MLKTIPPSIILEFAGLPSKRNHIWFRLGNSEDSHPKLHCIRILRARPHASGRVYVLLLVARWHILLLIVGYLYIIVDLVSSVWDSGNVKMEPDVILKMDRVLVLQGKRQRIIQISSCLLLEFDISLPNSMSKSFLIWPQIKQLLTMRSPVHSSWV